MLHAQPVKTRAVKYMTAPVKRWKAVIFSDHDDHSARERLTMILVMATNASMKVIYAFVRLNVSSTENVFTESPPPRIATRSKPCSQPRRECHDLHLQNTPFDARLT